MQLNKHDAQTDMEMNMTPMIDVVFLLIIFFMIITDLTQQDLEDIKLPVAYECVTDQPDPKVHRPIVNINAKGEMVVRREMIFDPETGDLKELQSYLVNSARAMNKEHFDKEAQKGPLIPDDPLLIRADINTPFKYVQKVMEVCGNKDIQIWKIEIGTAEADDKKKDEE